MSINLGPFAQQLIAVLTCAITYFLYTLIVINGTVEFRNISQYNPVFIHTSECFGCFGLLPCAGRIDLKIQIDLQ